MIVRQFTGVTNIFYLIVISTDRRVLTPWSVLAWRDLYNTKASGYQEIEIKRKTP